MSDLKDQIRKAEASVASRPVEMAYLSTDEVMTRNCLHHALFMEVLEQGCVCGGEEAWDEMCTTCLIQHTIVALNSDARQIESLQRSNEELRQENEALRKGLDRAMEDYYEASGQTGKAAAITPELREKGENLLRAFEHNMFGVEDDMAKWVRDLLSMVDRG